LKNYPFVLAEDVFGMRQVFRLKGKSLFYMKDQLQLATVRRITVDALLDKVIYQFFWKQFGGTTNGCDKTRGPCQNG
jgi:hypothetical protein